MFRKKLPRLYLKFYCDMRKRIWNKRLRKIKTHMVSINHLFLKSIEESSWETNLDSVAEEILEYHRGAQRATAARVKVFKEELVARACHVSSTV